MAKDPAFLFYPGDWLGGTQLFSRAHKGAYMDVLMAQYANGHLSIDDIKAILNGDFELMWESKLKAKFKIDDNGLYFNEKLEQTISDRRKFTTSRLENLKGNNTHTDTHKKPHTGSRMENENEIEDKKRKGKSKIENDNPAVTEIIGHLNDLNGTNFRTDTKATVRLIEQRIKDGFPVVELKEIIEYKVAEWKGTIQEKWLQPDTLFAADNCAKYRNQVQAAKDKGLTAKQIKGRTNHNGPKTSEELMEEIRIHRLKKQQL